MVVTIVHDRHRVEEAVEVFLVGKLKAALVSSPRNISLWNSVSEVSLAFFFIFHAYCAEMEKFLHAQTSQRVWREIQTEKC